MKTFYRWKLIKKNIKKLASLGPIHPMEKSDDRSHLNLEHNNEKGIVTDLHLLHSDRNDEIKT